MKSPLTTKSTFSNIRYISIWYLKNKHTLELNIYNKIWKPNRLYSSVSQHNLMSPALKETPWIWETRWASIVSSWIYESLDLYFDLIYECVYACLHMFVLIYKCTVFEEAGLFDSIFPFHLNLFFWCLFFTNSFLTQQLKLQSYWNLMEFWHWFERCQDLTRNVHTLQIFTESKFAPHLPWLLILQFAFSSSLLSRQKDLVSFTLSICCFCFKLQILQK